MSVKEPYDSNWQERVRMRIRRSDGVIALVSRNRLNSSGETWEISCAKAEGKKIIGLWISKADYTMPSELSGYHIIPWTWQGVANFIDGL